VKRIFVFARSRSDGDRVGANVVGVILNRREGGSMSRTRNQLGLKMGLIPAFGRL